MRVAKALDRHGPATVYVGVAGHRFLQNVDELIPAIDRVLDLIETQWPGRSLTAISSLAEGSDRLVTMRVLARPAAKLVVPLPLHVAEFMRDFENANSRREFAKLLEQADEIVHVLPEQERPQAYVAAGRYIVEHADILMALWDGEPALGAGGTAAVIVDARRLAIPIAWIRARNCRPERLRCSKRFTQGQIFLENLK